MAVGLLAIAIAVVTVWVVYQLAVARSRRFPDLLPAVLAAVDEGHVGDKEERDAVAKKEQADARVRVPCRTGGAPVYTHMLPDASLCDCGWPVVCGWWSAVASQS